MTDRRNNFNRSYSFKVGNSLDLTYVLGEWKKRNYIMMKFKF